MRACRVCVRSFVRSFAKCVCVFFCAYVFSSRWPCQCHPKPSHIASQTSFNVSCISYTHKKSEAYSTLCVRWMGNGVGDQQIANTTPSMVRHSINVVVVVVAAARTTLSLASCSLCVTDTEHSFVRAHDANVYTRIPHEERVHIDSRSRMEHSA